MKLRVLVTNDDGVNAEGLWFLIGILLDMGFDVRFATTEKPYSGASKSVTWNFKATVKEVNGVRGLIVSGTPSTAILYALHDRNWIPDLVVSGINHGANLGLEDVYTSGTFGAALESVFQGIPSIAISKFIKTPTSKPQFSDRDKFYLKHIISKFARAVLEKEDLSCIPLNVNLPIIPSGIALTNLSHKVYRNITFIVEKGEYKVSRAVDDFYRDGLEECNDIWAVYNSYVSISPTCPLCISLTRYGAGRKLDWLRVFLEGIDNGIECI